MRRILIVRTDRVGDVVMTTPMIREIRKTFPDAFIATLTQPNTRDIFLNNPHVSVSISDDLQKDTFWKTVHELRRYSFTDGLLVLPTRRAAYQMFLAGIGNRIGVGHIFYEVITLMKGVSRNKYVPLRHEADYCMDLARRIGVKTDNIAPEIFVGDDERATASEFLGVRGIKREDKKIIIHTGSGGSSPNWPENKYFGLVKTFLAGYPGNDVKIILTAKEMSDDFRKDAVQLNSGRVYDVTGGLKKLRDIIALISQADLLISSSTGPLHIANALNTGCIGLYCHRPMNCPALWGVFNKRSINLEVPEEYCNSHCSHNRERCEFENGISIDHLMEKIKLLL